MKKRIVMVLLSAIVMSATASPVVYADEYEGDCEDGYNWDEEEDYYEDQGGEDYYEGQGGEDYYEGQGEEAYYFWEDGSGNIWYHNGFEDEYFGSTSQYSLDPDTGEPMEIEGNSSLGSDQPTDYGDYYWTDDHGNIWHHVGNDDEFFDDGSTYTLDPDTGEPMERQPLSSSEDGSYYWMDACGGIWCIWHGEYYYISDSSVYCIGEDGDLYRVDGKEKAGNPEDLINENIEAHTYMSFLVPADMKLIEYTDQEDGSYTQVFLNDEGTITVLMMTSPTGKNGELDMTAEDYVTELYAPSGEMTKEDTAVSSYPATKYTYTTGANEDTTNVEALCFQTDTDYHCLLVLTDADAEDSVKDEAASVMESMELKDRNGESSSTILTPYFTVAVPEVWKDLYTFAIENTSDGGYILSFSADGKVAVSFEVRAIAEGEGEFEPDSVGQCEIGYVTDSEGVQYRLLETISQTAQDATANFQTLLDTNNQLEVISSK